MRRPSTARSVVITLGLAWIAAMAGCSSNKSAGKDVSGSSTQTHQAVYSEGTVSSPSDSYYWTYGD